jgi:hypothetical protein
MARRKINRKPGHATVKANHDAWLRSMGINPDKKPSRRNLKGIDMPDLSVQSTNTIKTSDKICGSGSIKESQTYTGNEIMGITLLHKSSFEPIRKDNKQAAVDAAHMRRN